MKRRTLGLGILVILAAVVAAVMTRGLWMPQGAVAQGPRGPRPIPIETAVAVKKNTPVQIEAIGTVTPMASVAIKSRLETVIVEVHFSDGAVVRQGDLLFTLDSRAIEAQIRQAQGNLERSRAQLAGAERDVRRYTELVAKSATPQTNLDNAKTQSDIFKAAIETDQALLDNLKIQLGYATIRAPISGRISTANVKVGNFVRPADVAAMATIIQTAPIYATFPVAQRHLPDIRQAIANETATVDATMQGDARAASGQVTLIENIVDMATGMVTIRATIPNADELLWPGALVNVHLTLRTEDAIVVPTVAVQVGQQGSFVYVVKDSVARTQPVTVSRTIGSDSLIASGLTGGETVVTDGHLLLTNGARVAPRGQGPGGGPRPGKPGA